MKLKILFLTVLVFCAIESTAQIKNNILGFTLGVTTKSQFVNTLKRQSIRYDTDGDNFMVYYQKFAGVQWDDVIFEFYDNKLKSVYFQQTSTNISEEAVVGSYNQIKRDLHLKYGQYYQGEANGRDVYSDTTLNIIHNIQFDRGLRYNTLLYVYLPLLYKSQIQDFNDL